MKIGLVACTTKKLAGTHEAQIAYTSRTFTAGLCMSKSIVMPGISYQADTV